MPYTFAYFKDGNRYKSVLGGQFNNSDNGTPQINKDTIVFVGGADVSADDLRDGIYAQGKYFGVGTGSSSSFNLSEHTRGQSSGDDYAVKLKNDQLFVTVPTNAITPEDPEPVQSVQYKFEVAFAVVPATNTNPAKPIGTVPSTGQTRGGVTWYPTGPNTVNENCFTWMTTRTVVVGGFGTEAWDAPFIIGSAGSAGEDGIHGINGDKYEYIYSRTTSTNNLGGYPLTAPASITTAAAGSKGSSVNAEDFVPRGWTDNPQGVSAELQFEWMSIRRGRYDANNIITFSTFTTPTLWSKYGVNGTDGDGFDYIFALLHEGETLPTNTPDKWNATIAEFQQRDYILPALSTIWYDDAPEMTTPGDEIWYCTREKYADSNNDREDERAYWHAYSKPKLWSRYAKDGHDSDDPTPTHPQNMVIGGNGVDGEEEFNANKNSYLENVMIAVRDKNGVIKFWAMKVSGVWNYVYAPNTTTIPPTSGLELYGMDQWNACDKDIYTVYTIYSTDGSTVLGYGINGIFVALPGSQDLPSSYNTVYVYGDEWDPNTADPNTIYYVEEECADGVYRIIGVYLGSHKISSGTEAVVAKSEFTSMFTRAIAVNKNDVADLVWSVINVDDPEAGYLGSYRASLEGALTNVAALTTSVSGLDSRVTALAQKVTDDGEIISARLDTVVEWDEESGSWKAKVISDANEIIQQATESITSSVIENVNREIVDENGEVRTVVDQLVSNQIEQNGKGIFLSAFGDEEGGYKTIGLVGVTSDQITLGALKYNSTSGKYEVDSDTLFTVNLQDNKIVAAADTFVITGDLIADGISTNGLNVGDGKFVVDNDGTVHTNGAVMVGPQVQHSVRTVLTGDRSSISNHVTLGSDIIIVKGNSGMGQAQIVFPPAYLFPGAELRVINAVEDYAIFKFEIGRKDGEQGRAEETGNGNQSMNDFYIAVPFRVNGLDTTTYGSHMELEVHECRFIDFVSVPNPEYPNYYVWMVVDVRQENI